ncbi:MAG: type II secretion system protein N [Burkholderiales bacterium]
MTQALARTAVVVLSVLACAALAAVVAWWGWRAFGPAPVRIVPAAPADPVATLLASGLLAGPGTPAPAAPAAKDETMVTGDTHVVGVFAERGGRGYALFKLASGPKVVAAGQEITPGATLVAVRPDGITVRDASGERRIALRGEVPAKAAAAPARPKAAVATLRNPACVPPADFKGTVLRLNAELFQGIVAKPESWTALVTADRDGLTVKDESGFVTMLAMKKGDRLLQANGVALGVPDDVVSAVLKPLAAQQPVRVLGTRAGSPREWLLLNSGSCP